MSDSKPADPTFEEHAERPSAWQQVREGCHWVLIFGLCVAFVLCIGFWLVSTQIGIAGFDTWRKTRYEFQSVSGRLILVRLSPWRWQDGPELVRAAEDELPEGPVTRRWVGFDPAKTFYGMQFEASWGQYTTHFRPAPPDEPTVDGRPKMLMSTVRYQLIAAPWWFITALTGLASAIAIRTSPPIRVRANSRGV